MSADQQTWREFEDLIESMHRGFHPGAKITRNEKLRGQNSHVLRDVDICIRQKVGLQEILIAVDCKKRSRKVDVPQMHEFVGLKDDVCASLGIIVNERGFSKGAITLARRNNVRPLTFRDTKNQNWQSDYRIPMCLEMLIMVPCGIKIQYLGQPEQDLLSDKGLVMGDIEANERLTAWEYISKMYFEEQHIEPGFWSKKCHFLPHGFRPIGTIDFSVYVERRRYISRAGLDFLGLVDQHTNLAHVSNLESPPIKFSEIEKTWRRLGEFDSWPIEAFSVMLKTVLPPKKEGNKIAPAFPEKTLVIKIGARPEAPIALPTEKLAKRRTSSGGESEFTK